jgi:hypothetical protein
MCITISSLVNKECGTFTTAGYEVLNENSLHEGKQYVTYTGLCLGSEKCVH